MKSFNILGVHGKTQFLEGGKRGGGGGGHFFQGELQNTKGHQKPIQYIGGIA